MWKIIKDFPRYEVSDEGEVRNIKTGRIMKQSPNQDGYMILQLTDGIKPKMKRVHRLVLETFCPIENSEDYEVNHKDGNVKNNNLNNLEWCTDEENQQHREREDNPKRLQKRIKVTFDNGEEIIFDSVTKCGEYLNIPTCIISDYAKRKKKNKNRQIQAIFTYI